MATLLIVLLVVFVLGGGGGATRVGGGSAPLALAFPRDKGSGVPEHAYKKCQGQPRVTQHRQGEGSVAARR